VYVGDVSTVIGKYSLRGETAYVHTADPKGKNLFIKNPYWTTVLGGDSYIIKDTFRFLIYFPSEKDLI
jgi:hypothetical protein